MFLVNFMMSILHAQHVDYSLKNNQARSSTDSLGPDCTDSAKQNLRKSANGASGMSDIEGKAARVSGERVWGTIEFQIGGCLVDFRHELHQSRAAAVRRNVV
jgi:hypothetical protein